jgi:hypothetical protein
MDVLFTMSYLLNSPGLQQVMVWGGHEAGELVRGAVGLVGDAERLHAVGTAWHAAAGDLREAHSQLTEHVTALAGWESGTARAYRAEHGARVAEVGALAGRYQATGSALHAAGEQLGRIPLAMLASCHATGQAVQAMLTSGLTPHGAVAAVVAGWLTGARQLLAAARQHADQVAAELATHQLT